MSVRRAIAEADLATLNVTGFCEVHGVSRSWFYEIRERVRTEGAAAIEPRSRAPHRVVNRTPVEVEDEIVALRKALDDLGVDSGPATIVVHLARRVPAELVPSESTVWRILSRRGFVPADPSKRPRSSLSFAAERANECWQIDDFHWTLADGTPVKIIDVIDDCTRVCVASVAATSCNGETAFGAMTTAANEWGWPERFLSDNARTYKHRLADALAALDIRAGHSRPYHPQTCGKVERLHGTVKKWLRARPPATTIAELQHHLDEFRAYYNHQRPHRSLNRVPPAIVWAATPKSGPRAHAVDQPTRTHTGKVSNGSVTINPGPYRISLGAAHTGRYATTVVTGNRAHVFVAGQLVRQLTINPDRRDQPLHSRPGRPSTTNT